MNKRYLYIYLGILAGYTTLVFCTLPLGWVLQSELLWLYNLLILVAALILTGCLAVKDWHSSRLQNWLKLVWVGAGLALLPGLVTVSTVFFLIAIDGYKLVTAILGIIIFSIMLLLYSCLTSLLGWVVQLYFRYKKPVPG